MIEFILGLLFVWVIFKCLFGVLAVIFSPIILLVAMMLSLGLFFSVIVGGLFILTFKLLLVPILLLLLIPLCLA